MNNTIDYLVIGGGPAGYVSAIKAAQLGLGSVYCVEKKPTLGGTCLNEGCIPSKALLHSSYLYYQAKNHFNKYGINATATIDVCKMQSAKDQSIKELATGIDHLFKKNKITRLFGTAQFKDASTIEVSSTEGKKILKAKHTVIATGSKVATLSNIKIDGKIVIDSSHALKLDSIPKKLLIVGAGAIGLEMASVWSRLGSNVTVVEFLNKIAPAMDDELSSELQKELEKQSINFLTECKVASIQVNQNNAEVSFEQKNKQKKESFDKVLVCVGRVPNTEGLGLQNASIETDERGAIITNSNFETNAKGIFAIGDVIKGPMLAHKASDEGVAIAQIIAGQKPLIDYNLIPSVIYTNPETASIGKTEQQLKKHSIDYKKGLAKFSFNSRAKANQETTGFVKILTCAKTDEILGVHIMHSHAATLIGEASVAMAYGASAEDISLICHSHPDYNESIKEAALGAFFKPIHG